MNTIVRRRRIATTALVFVSAAGLTVYAALELSLRDTAVGTGLVLLALVAGLTGLNVRKKIPLFPLVTSSTLLQLHIYAGLFAMLAFGMHVEFRAPRGGLETILTILFWSVVLSGVVGLAVTRTIPRRLRTRGEPVLFERHPMLLRTLRHRLDACLAEAADSPSLTEYHANFLAPFFARPRHFWRHLAQSDRPRAALLDELDALRRYLNDDEDRARQRIAELVSTKSDLDYHYAHQAVLKYWLFAHIPLSYSLLITGVVHGFVAYAWSG